MSHSPSESETTQGALSSPSGAAQDIDLVSVSAATNFEFDRFEEQLHAGYYTGILDTYGVSWTLEKITRDTLQNFYDPHLTLDGVDIQIESKGILRVERTVRIDSEPEYDYRKLIHIGGTSKAGNSTSAGGFGEGAKIMSLVLLRDYGFSQVKFGSGDWELEFYLDHPPEGSYDDVAQGLYAKLTRVEYRPGNFVEFVTGSKDKANAFLQARDFFYHEQNSDFQDPTLEVELQQGGRFGFKLLGPRSYGSLGRNGHLYDSGQRRHYRTESGWDEVEGMHIWTIGRKVFHLDRDRSAVSVNDLKEQLIQPIIAELSEDQIEQCILKLEDIWEVCQT